MPATNDSITSGTFYAIPGGSVDGNSPVARSKKATRLNMSVAHRFGTSYELSSVMNGYRGDKSIDHAIPLNGRSQISTSETMKKKGYGPMESHTHPFHQTPAFGAAIRA